MVLTTWTYELVSHSGTPLAELPARGRKLTLARNAGGSASCTISLLEAADPAIAPHLRLGEVDLLVSRDGVRIWRGSAEAAQGTLGTETGDMEIAGASLWSILERRYVPLGLEITVTEATTIAWQLIRDAQLVPYGALGIVQGDTPPSHARTRRWDSPTTVAAAVQELAELEGGFDWSLSPQGDGLRWDAWFPRQGDVKPHMVLEWGRNVQSVQWSIDASKITNEATSRTANQIGVLADDLTSQGNYRLRAAEDSAGDVSDAGVLAARAGGLLRPVPVAVPRLTCVPGAVTLDDIGIGDVVPVDVRHGWLRIEGLRRVEQIDVEISDEGQEQLTITVQEDLP